MTVLRQAQIVLEVLTQSDPHLRQTQTVLEVLSQQNPHLRLSQLVVEVLAANNDGQVHLLMPQLVVEVLAVSYYDPVPISTFTSRLGQPESRLSEIVLAASGPMPNGPSTYDETLIISGTSAFSVLDGGSIAKTLTIDGTSAVSFTFNYGQVVFLTIAGTSAFTSPGGLVQNISFAIEGLASISPVVGYVYDESFSFDGTSDLTTDFIYILNGVISLDATADMIFDTLATSVGNLTIAGTSHIDLTSTGVWYESVGVFGTSKIFIENIYDVLLVNAVLAGFSATVTKTAPGDENPGAIGSFSAVAQCVFNRPATQNLFLVQTVVVKKPTWLLSQSLNFTEQAVCQKTHAETITDTLTLTQEAIAVRAISQTFSMADNATCIRVQSRSVAQTLTLTDVLTRSITISRSLTDTLVYNPPNLQKLPIIGSQNQGVNRQFEYYVPTTYVVLVPRQCLIILGVPSKTILLPCPIWGDHQAYQGEINLKRSMTGLTYTYVKKVQTQKLHYSFELWTNKYLELRQFFIDHAEEVIMLQNHNAETWLVRLVNNPIEFTTEGRWQPKGEKYTVTLEFEGVKIGG